MAAYHHVYVHLPFCEVICHYCDFYTARAKYARHDEFFAALLRELTNARAQLSSPLAAVYLGGGTPSVSPAPLLRDFLRTFGDHIGPGTEITMEANPTNLHEENLSAWREMGINRISLGVQSLNDVLLKRLGRVHTGEAALAALTLAKKYIPNVNADLIYAVPGQDETEPAHHALRLAEVGATHISAYHLTLPQTHFLFAQLPPDELAWSQIKALTETLAPRGFAHYEVSNLALPGFESRNNANYWGGGPYWALGPSAHGFDGERQRWKNVPDWEEYVRRIMAGASAEAEREELSLEQRRIEYLFTALRTNRGLNLEAFSQQFGHDIMQRNSTLLKKLLKEGLATLDNGHFALTFSGKMLADEIVRKLL
jgi:oxygen-independent coproporphyrinogen-3 oxidase